MWAADYAPELMDTLCAVNDKGLGRPQNGHPEKKTDPLGFAKAHGFLQPSCRVFLVLSREEGARDAFRLNEAVQSEYGL